MSDNHPDLYPKLFREACCEGGLIELPGTIPVHGRPVDEWLAAGG